MSLDEGIIIEGLKNRISEFFKKHHEEELEELAETELQENITIDYKQLAEFDQTIADDLANSPDQWITNAKAALRDYEDHLENTRILVSNYEKYNPAIRNLRDKHFGKLTRLDGTVSKATSILPKADVAAFECQVCGTVTKVKQPLDSDLEYPRVCSGEDCDNRTERKFRVNPTLSNTINFRKIEIQEPPEETSGGQTPETQTFSVKGDIADNITAGDNVTAIGIYKASDQGNTSIFRTYVKGNNIIPEEKEFEELEISDEDIEQIKELAQQDDIYEQLRDSVAPNLYELTKEKEAILYQLFRGVRKTKMEGTTVRGDIHVLLVGDPGVGKTIHERSIIIGKNGNPKKIGEFVEEHMDDPEVDEDGDLIQEIENKDVKVMAMDKDGEIEPRNVEAVWKKQSTDNKVKVRLKDGRSIESSPTHPLFTTDDDAHIEQIKAGNIEEDDYIAVPNNIDYGATKTVIEAANDHTYSKINPPENWNQKFTRFVATLIAEGHVSESGLVSITNEDEEILQIAKEGFDMLELDYRIEEKDGTDAKEVVKGCKELKRFLCRIDESLIKNSRGKRVPPQIFTASEDIRTEFVRTYIDGEIHVDGQMRRELNAGSMSKDLLHDVQRLLDTLGISSRVKTRTNKSAEEGVIYRLRITGKAFEEYTEEIGFVSERKQERAEKIIEESGELNTNVDVVPDVQDVIKEMRELLGMTQEDFSISRSTYHGYEYEGKEVPREQLKRLVRDMVGKLRVLRGFEEVGESELTWSLVDWYRKFASLDQAEVAEDMDLTQTGYSYKAREKPMEGGQMAVQAHKSIQEQVDEDLHEAHENLIRLESLAWGDIRWVPVESVEEVECDDEWFYDLQVEGTHNYIANGIMSHNSQLLRYASKLAPRGVMTSGQGASEAGLCVGPSTTVSIDGESQVIEDVVQDRIESPVSTPTAVEVDDMMTVSADYDDGVVDSKVTHLWRMPEQEGVEISLDNGDELVVSGNTPLITEHYDGRYVWTDASEIKLGDYVGVFPESEDLGMTEHGEVAWAKVTGVDSVVTEMYDMTTGVGNFYANGVVAHNTAAAVRDSEFGGEDKWTLKAGALVLADQGLACVDEIDKMSSSDRSSMHEGLEQQTISVSKAGINSTLKSRCTLLAAANPKDGRWNEFDPVPAQINLEPPLVSRFDMIFAPEDERTEERDTKLAGHILDTNLRGQQLESGIEPDEETGEVEPDISPELFRKYVAHSRKNHDPVMTEDAMDYIKEFFVSIRAEGEQEGAIPVTARKIEAIVRISEAAARIQLSGTVNKEHAERARDIVMESLKDVGYDEEAGRFDVDMTETNQSTSQRNRRNMLVKTIEDNEDEGEKGAPRDLVVELMIEEHGFDEDKVEYDLRKMGRESEDIYEPTNGEFATL